jgi:hypothetical protein
VALVEVLHFRLMTGVACGEAATGIKERDMKHYAGLDVSVEETAVCIVDERRAAGLLPI